MFQRHLARTAVTIAITGISSGLFAMPALAGNNISDTQIGRPDTIRTSATRDMTAKTCFGGAITVPYDGAGLYPDGSGRYTTTSRCNDINMKVAQGSVSACVIFIDHTQDCNRWTPVGTGWVTIATSVKDGTHFRVGVQGADSQIGVNMNLAY